MTKPTPFFVGTMVLLLVLILSLWVIATVFNAAMTAHENSLLQSQTTYQPRQLDCPDGVALWDCIIYNTEQ